MTDTDLELYSTLGTDINIDIQQGTGLPHNSSKFYLVHLN